MPCQFTDESSGQVVLQIPDGANRVGVFGTADPTHPFAIAGQVFVTSAGILGASLCTEVGCNPIIGSVSVPASGSVQVSTGVSQTTTATVDPNAGANGGATATATTPTAGYFYVKNSGATTSTIGYNVL